MTDYFDDMVTASAVSEVASAGKNKKNQNRLWEKAPGRRGCSLCYESKARNPFTRAEGEEDEAHPIRE
jgi:hypothetical protein